MVPCDHSLVFSMQCCSAAIADRTELGLSCRHVKHVHISINVCIYTYTSGEVYIQIYTYVYICMCMYIYTHKDRKNQ